MVVGGEGAWQDIYETASTGKSGMGLFFAENGVNV